MILFLEQHFGKLKLHVGEFEHCGIIHKQDPVSFTVTLSQDHYCKQLKTIPLVKQISDDEPLTVEIRTLFESLLGALSWLTQTRPDICIYVQALQRISKKATGIHVKRINRITKWVKRKSQK